MKQKSPKLPLTDKEREQLRKGKIRLSEIKEMKANKLAALIEVPNERARELIGLAVFQSIPSVGPKLAHNLAVDLGFSALEDVKNRRGEELVHELEKKYGVWMDPCVEDVMRCVVYHANHPGSDKNWWEFTEDRKKYREIFGYPDDRPVKAWHE
ncbi:MULTISPECIES: helix-hairpin-helix domain-containing protein [Metabacillus]|uniref:Helix-hairpin-helix domain-containing protein n=1 Tax=Metabacillus hrfriensis TaxID=3048891 RepID=A0ACD4R5Z9_9BACI|nr:MULTISPECIES: helix-hairpin-helix domain-containing protein [Metabacillus]UAL50408.1 helix-hairpin-helix domain-containing protein [Metabacillus dongyingensis]USK26666.1 helix-hairpin-helix domain-containing protein [Bacillus sp. CMF21]WHZ55887.1 helix-hairpin-helix domain-containing protein [Metabacillus sp. CT-WN-B3]